MLNSERIHTDPVSLYSLRNSSQGSLQLSHIRPVPSQHSSQPPPPPPPKTSQHPIHNAVYAPKLDLKKIKSLILSEPSCVAAVNPQNGYTPLHAAARRGEPSLVKLLIEYGCPLDARANHGETAFLISCQVRSLKSVHLLAESGADTQLANENGKTAIHYASEVGSVPILCYLVEVLHHDVRCIDNQGNNALHYAVRERVVLSIDHLLKHKYIDVDTANYEGCTPVHIAARNGSTKMIWDLLSSAKGMEFLLTRNGEGLTPEGLAKKGSKSGHKAVARSLPLWQCAPNLMRRTPWFYWFIFFIMPGSFLIVADIVFCYVHHPLWSLILGSLIGLAGFYFPVANHRLSHPSGWHNPAFMGAVLSEISHTGVCYLIRILPVLWPGNIFIICCLVVNTIFGIYILIKFKISDPGFDKVGRLGVDGKPLTVLDVAKQQPHNLSYSEMKMEEATGFHSVLQFCDSCEIVIPDRTKHCKLCNACCNGFDHHCLWLTSCVGYSNHRIFILFTLSLTIEIFLFLWDATIILSRLHGNNFPWNIWKEEESQIERWIKFRILVAIWTITFTISIIINQLKNISKLETSYFDLSGSAAFGRQRASTGFSLATRLRLIYLFFMDYQKWYNKTCHTTPTTACYPQPQYQA